MTNKRLTKHWGDNYVATELNYDFLFSLSKEDTESFNAIIKKLAYYEDLEEQGRLVVPPCKVGDLVYFKGVSSIAGREVVGFAYSRDMTTLEHVIVNLIVDEQGTTQRKFVKPCDLYFDRKEAEKAFEEMKN